MSSILSVVGGEASISLIADFSVELNKLRSTCYVKSSARYLRVLAAEG